MRSLRLARFMASSTCLRSLSSLNLSGEKLQHSSVQHLHPCVRDFAQDLAKTQPCIRLSSRNVEILSEPAAFLETLLDMMQRAQKRIFLSSLYIGSAETRLMAALESALRRNPSLQVTILLDYNRSTRPGPASTASLLLPLIKAYPGQIHTHFFKSPKLKGIMEKVVPRRFDEGWGTWHAKVYGADDEVIITGANLNQSYFTNRQDRYLHFKSAPLSDYCLAFIQIAADYTFQLRPSDASAYSLFWPNQNHRPKKIEHPAGLALRVFQSQQRERFLQEDINECTNEDILLFPIVQGGQFGIREEERCLKQMFQRLDDFAKSSGITPMVDVTSGYFGLYKPYQELVRKSYADVRVLAASPKANGFYGSSGISGRIPEGYTLLEQRFWKGIEDSKRTWDGKRGVQLHEWARNDWTYHAKGIWISPSADTEIDGANGDLPVMTLFGSTNLNSRSANLDTELVFAMFLPNSEDALPLRKSLKEEVVNLRQHANPWQGSQRHVGLGTKLLVRMVGGML